MQELIDKCEKREHDPEYLFAAPYVFDNEDSLEPPSFMRVRKIVVVGSINLDVTFNVDWLPQSGRTTTILNSATAAGGKGLTRR